MKKAILVLTALVISASMLYSQPFAKGNHCINAGIGFGNVGYFGSNYSGFIPSISGSWEMGIVEVPMGPELNGVVSVGAYAGWSASKYSYTYWGGGNYYTGSSFFMAARGNYHFIFHDQLDTYAGILFGARFETWKWKGSVTLPSDATLSNDVDPVFGAYVGARWFFTPAIAAYAELGYLISVFNIGVTFKIEGKQ